jgi:trk system potassium uptake protein TrkA
MPRRQRADLPREHVMVIGLGWFGRSVARTLVALDHEVLGIDDDADVVAELSTELTAVVEADGTNVEALEQLGAREYTRALVGIGDVEASVLTAFNLVDLGITQVWAKALSERHASILDKLGVQHVVSPEKDAGMRVGHLMAGTMLDFIEVDAGWALVKVAPPAEAVGRTLAESSLRRLHNVTVVGTKRPGHDFVYARPETVVTRDDVLIIAGATRDCEQFSAYATQSIIDAAAGVAASTRRRP